MEIKEAVVAAIKELIFPEIQELKNGQSEIKATLFLTNKRLDDMNAHLVDQGRRIDETNKRIDSVRDELFREIQETNKRIDSVRDELSREIQETNKRIDETNKRLDETNKRIDTVRDGLFREIQETNKRIDSVRDELFREIQETNKRLDRLFEVIVRREEHQTLEARLFRLEQDVDVLKKRFAA